MTYNATHLKKAFLEEMLARLNPYGFLRKDERLYRVHPYGKDIMRFGLYGKRTYVEVDLTIGVRHDVVQSVIVEFSPRLPKFVIPWFSTVDIRMGTSMRKDVSWDIMDEYTISQVCDAVMELFDSFIDHYFHRFSSLKEIIDASMSDDKAENDLVGPLAVRNAIAAVAAAYVFGDRRLFQEVVDKKSKEMERFKGHFQFAERAEDFFHMAKVLEERMNKQQEK